MEARVLVGRERELDALDAICSRVASGERAVAMITGEPGIGKTRLLEELAARVRAAGGAVGWGRAAEVGITPAFWPWIQALAALEADGDRAPSLASAEPRADAAGRLARFGEVAAFLARRAAVRPIALVLDDVHAADPSSLQLLEDVLPLVAGKPVLVALGARDSDADRDIQAVLGRLQRGALRLPLARLGAADVAALVAALGARADSARVYELSDGNPLFVEELIATAPELRLPALSSVRALIRERVARLPADTGAALAAAAVVGREFRGSVVAEVAAGSLEPAVRIGLVAIAAPDRYRFSHALVAEALAGELEAGERGLLHLRAARAIEKHEPRDTSAIAHHLIEARDPAAVDAAERAARDSLAQLAFEHAARLLARATELASDVATRARLACLRAEALQHASQYALAAELCDGAAALARQLGDPELLAKIALVRGLEMRFGRTDAVLVEALREALERIGERDPALRAKLLARLAAAEQPALDAMQPVARALEAIELARDLAARDRLDVMYVATAALVDYVEPRRLEEIHREVLGLARGVDPSITAHTRLRLCFTALERVDRARFDSERAVFTAEAAALGLPRWQRHAHMLEAMAALLDGRFADAERAAALSEALPGHDPWIHSVHQVMARWVRTEPPDLAVLKSLQSYPPGRVAIRAWTATQAGNREEVRELLAQLPVNVPSDPDLAAMIAAAVAFAGTPEQAAQVYESLLPRRGRISLASAVGSAVMDLIDRSLLVLAAAAGRTDVIDEHALDALDAAARLGSPVWTARVRADWADALARRGDTGKASELRALALAGAERLGMPGLVARLRGTPADPAPAARTGERVTIEKRGALWRVAGFGEQIHVKDSRGIDMLARLVAEPGRDLHALDLAGGEDTGDAGPALDHAARTRYRSKLAELVAERDEAESWADAGRVARATAQIEALTAEIERAFGLGGRERKVGAASERARSNVQRRIAHALEQIRSASPRLGEHLAATVRTGTYCCYAP